MVDLKNFIINNDKIPDVLSKLGCHKIKSYSTEYRCALPRHSNPTAVQVKKDSLKSKIYRSEEKVTGDIVTLAMFILDCDFKEALKHIHEILGLEFSVKRKSKKTKRHPLDVFQKVKAKVYDDEKELKIYDESILRPYVIMPHIEFIKEGIGYDTQVKYNIGYCPHTKRIVIPHRYYNGGNNDFVGVMGRTTIKDHDILGIAKYYPLVRFWKTLNLYGLQENYEGIQEGNMVIVFEAEKSVLKCDTYGFKNAVSIGSHEISKEQERILIGLDVEIVIAFDKDVKEDFIKKVCKNFSKHRKVSYIYDKHDLLEENDSPIDQGYKKFNYLLKYRNTYKEGVNYGEVK